MPNSDDVAFLRRTFDVARRAKAHGNHPFGALLVNAGGEVLIEMENGYQPDRDAPRMPSGCGHPGLPSYDHPRSAHDLSASLCDVRRADLLGRHWRVVFGLSTTPESHHRRSLKNSTLDLPCRTVFAAGQRAVEVSGPLIEDEAAALHVGVWDHRPTKASE